MVDYQVAASEAKICESLVFSYRDQGLLVTDGTQCSVLMSPCCADYMFDEHTCLGGRSTFGTPKRRRSTTLTSTRRLNTSPLGTCLGVWIKSSNSRVMRCSIELEFAQPKERPAFEFLGGIILPYG
jgi:hypothetical protein